MLAWVRSLRISGGARVAQEEIAHRSGLDRSFMGAIERGERNPTLTTILKVAVALDVRPSDLMARFEEELRWDERGPEVTRDLRARE